MRIQIPQIKSKNATYQTQSNNISLNKKDFQVSFGHDLFLKSIKGLSCPYCNKKLFTLNEINKFKEKASNATGKKLSSIIKQYCFELDGIEKQVARILVRNADNNPQKSAAELIKMIAVQYEPGLIKNQQDILDSVFYKIKKSKFTQIANAMEENLNKELAKKTFKRKNIIRAVSNVYPMAKTAEEKLFVHTVSKSIHHLPSSGNSHPAFLIKYSKRTPEEFFTRLLTPLQATSDHIILNKEKYSNSEKNLLNVCWQCNITRGEKPFAKWIEKPSINENVVNYFKGLINQLGDSVKNYIAAVSDTMKKASNEKFDLTKKLELNG